MFGPFSNAPLIMSAMGGKRTLAGYDHAVRVVPLIGVVLLAACGEFERQRTLRSPEGVIATVAIPRSKDAFTVCFAETPLSTCPRSRAAIYSYRGIRGDQRWIDSNVFLVEQLGGEVSGPPTRPIQVGTKQIEVRIEHQPCGVEARSINGQGSC